MKDKTLKDKKTKNKISDIVTYYMPLKFLKDVKMLAEFVGITIKEIKIEDRDVRFYCTGSDRLLDKFNELRVELLDPLPKPTQGK